MRDPAETLTGLLTSAPVERRLTTYALPCGCRARIPRRRARPAHTRVESSVRTGCGAPRQQGEGTGRVRRRPTHARWVSVCLIDLACGSPWRRPRRRVSTLHCCRVSARGRQFRASRCQAGSQAGRVDAQERSTSPCSRRTRRSRLRQRDGACAGQRCARSSRSRQGTRDPVPRRPCRYCTNIQPERELGPRPNLAGTSSSGQESQRAYNDGDAWPP